MQQPLKSVTFNKVLPFNRAVGDRRRDRFLRIVVLTAIRRIVVYKFLDRGTLRGNGVIVKVDKWLWCRLP
jgi:hypothetical protein